MPLLDYKTDKDADKRLNPYESSPPRSQEGFNKEASDILGGLNFDNLSDELNDLENNENSAPSVENPSRSEQAQNFLKDNEAQPPGGGFNFNPKPTSRVAGGTKKVVISFLKKRGSIMVITGVAGASIVGILAFFGGATMVTSLFENATWGNDAASSIMDHRARRQIKKILKADPGDICGNKITIKCKSKTPSHKFLDNMSKNGITAFDADGKIDTKKSGLTKKPVTRYEVDLGDGKSFKGTPSQFADFLDDPKNVKTAAKVWGRKGIVNMRWRAWNGKYIGKKLFSKFGVNKKGGIAENDKSKKSSDDADDTKKSKKTADERTKAFKDSVPDNGDVKNASSNLKNKLGKTAGRVGKGGAAYTAAVASCVAVKLPAMIATAKAKVELAQVIIAVTNMIYAPGSMQKASGLGSGFTQEAAEAVGNFLTKKVPDENGVLKSALESPVLLSAIGVNKNKINIPGNLTPGYSALNNPLVKFSQGADEESEDVCNTIMSPYTMYSVMVGQAALAASGGVIPVLLNIAGGFAISKVFEEITKTEAFGNMVDSMITKALDNDFIKNAIEIGGYEAGQVLGLGLMLLPGLGNSARHINVLPKSEVKQFAIFQNENEKFHRDLEVATLSPFDTSSKYTFLGSIMHNMSMAMISRGNINNSLNSVLGNMFSLPAIALSSFTSPASASINYQSENYCDYATEWRQEAGDQTPGVKATGDGCHGHTSEQLSMSIDTAVDLFAEEGWIDESKDQSGDIDDLIESGYIKDNSPIVDFITDCGDGSTGEYIINNPSCTVPEAGGSLDQLKAPETGEEENSLKDDIGGPTVATSLKSESSMAAISVFLTEHQTMLALSGEDDGYPDDETSSSNSVSGDITGEVDPEGWASPVEPGNVLTSGYGPRWNSFHDGVDLAGTNGAIFAVRDGTVITVVSGCTVGDTRCGGGWGSYVSIDHGEVSGLGHIYSFYSHLASVNTSTGSTVKAGQQIGVMGETGFSFGVHLHFGIYKIPPGVNDYGSNTYDPIEVVPPLRGAG